MYLFEVKLETLVKDVVNLMPEIGLKMKNGELTKAEVYELVHNNTSKQDVAKKLSKMNVKLSPQMQDRLANFTINLNRMNTAGLSDEDTDTVGYLPEPTPPRPEFKALPRNRLSEIPKDKELVKKTVNIDWLAVSDLPGYMQQSIRMAAREFLAPFTKANLADMQILASLNLDAMANMGGGQRALPRTGGQTKDAATGGPSSMHELLFVKKLLTTHGTKLTDATIDGAYNNLIPGYGISYSLWALSDGNTYLFAEDFIGDTSMGYYIYRWDSKFTKVNMPEDRETFKDYLGRDKKALR